MKFISALTPKHPEDVAAFIKEQPYGMLNTTAADGKIHCGLFNHVYDGNSFYLHLNSKDEQITDLKEKPRALFIFHEFLAIIPSYWVDPKNAGVATSYYRYAEFECTAELYKGEKELTAIFQSLMDHFQPEGKYEPLDPQSETYQSSYKMLTIVKLTPQIQRLKWKLGQNRSPETRRNVITGLRKRGSPLDLRCAELTERELG